jgi:hypothetical protein
MKGYLDCKPNKHDKSESSMTFLHPQQQNHHISVVCEMTFEGNFELSKFEVPVRFKIEAFLEIRSMEAYLDCLEIMIMMECTQPNSN